MKRRKLKGGPRRSRDAATSSTRARSQRDKGIAEENVPSSTGGKDQALAEKAILG